MNNFIIKFLRELNSADSSKSIILAIVFGLIVGFLPTVNFFTIMIFFIVLILRVPIGLFITSFGLFKIVGVLLDPVFHKIGLIILTSDILKPIWTFFYNLPFVRWSGFNNTIVMGSLILGSVFGIILYVVLNKLIIIYRNYVFEKLKRNKFLAWLVPEEKKGIIRISGIIFLSSIIGLVALFFMFLLDPIVKFSLEFSLSKVFHKRVTIQSLNTSIKDLSVDIKNMKIGNVLFQKVYTNLDWDKIVWRKYKIDDLEIIANTDKNIYSLISTKKSNKTSSSNKFNLNIKMPSPESVLAKEELKSIKALEKLKKDYKKIKKDLSKVNVDKYKNEVEVIKKELNSLKNIKIKSPLDFQNLLAKVKKVKSQTNDLIKKVKNDKKLLINDKKLLNEDLKNLKLALKEDKQNIISKYSMLKNKEYLKFTESILKPQISKYLKLASNIFEKLKPYISSDKNKKEYVRAKGIYIKFEDKIKYPDFVLVKSFLKLKTSIAKWNIKTKNISDNQNLLAKRAQIVFSGKSKFFDVGGDVSYLNDIKFNMYGNKVKIKKLDLNVVKMNALANIKIKGLIKNKNINSNILVYFNNPEFIENKVKFLKDIKMKHFKLVIALNGKIDSPKIKINSDLDKYFSKIIKDKLNQLIKANSNKSIKLLESKINNSLKDLNLDKLNLKIKDLNSIENIKEVINNQLQEIIKDKKKDVFSNPIKGLFR